MSRQVNREVIVILGWGRAVLMQLAHPLVAAGVAQHSNFGAGSVGYVRRSYRTIAAMLGLTFGTPEVVRAQAESINAIHRRVHGHLQKATTRFPGGTPYSATDPNLLAWVHATLVESQLISYQLFVGDLSAKMRDAYCAEAAQVGPSLGIPEGVLPHTESELRRYLDRMLTSGAIEVTDTARGLARLLLQPTGLFLRWALAPGRLVTAALLPETLRDAYGLPWNRGRQQRFRWLIRAIRAMHALIPQFLREWPVARK